MTLRPHASRLSACLLLCVPPPLPRYAFDDLSVQKSWTPAEIKERLPDGLGGMFRRAMKTLFNALQAERNDLQELLLLLLPVLVAARDSLTVEELAWATGADVNEVCASGYV